MKDTYNLNFQTFVLVCLSIISISLSYCLPSLIIDSPLIIGDEVGYLNNAIRLWGENFDGYTAYYYGYSLLLVPLVALFENTTDLYNAVQVFNKVLICIGLYSLYKMPTVSKPSSKAGAIITIVIISLYPSLATYSNFAIAESLLFTIFCAVLYTIDSTKESNLTSRTLFIILLLSLLLLAHPRTLSLFPPIYLIYLISCYKSTTLRKTLLVGATTFLGVILIYKFGRAYFHEATLGYTGDIGSGYKVPNASKALTALFSKAFFTVCIGQLSYSLAATFGLILVPIFSLLANLRNCLKQRSLNNLNIPVLYIVFTFFSILSLSVFFMRNGARGDHLIYGRYIEFIFPLAIAYGLYHLKKVHLQPIIMTMLLLTVLMYLLGLSEVGNINVINVSSFWPTYTLKMPHPTFWLITSILVFFLLSKSSYKYRLIIIGIVYTLINLSFYKNWSKPSNHYAGGTELYDLISNHEGTIGFDCKDFYYENPEGCGNNRTGCFKWAFLKYSYQFSRNNISKLYWDDWMNSNKEFFITSHYYQHDSVKIAGSSNLPSGTIYCYQKTIEDKGGCFLPYCYKWTPLNNKIHSNTGILNNGSIQTTNQDGLLIYGPYVGLLPGEYQIKVFGNKTSSGKLDFDIAHDRGRKIVFDYKTDAMLLLENILLDTNLVFRENMEDFELRIDVSSSTFATIDSITIIRQSKFESIVIYEQNFEDEGSILTANGSFNTGSITSNYQQGHLLYGPYIDITPGNYQLKIEYNKMSTCDPIIELAYNQGQTTIFEEVLNGELTSKQMKIYHIPIDERIKNLEIRVFTEEDCILTVSQLRFLLMQ